MAWLFFDNPVGLRFLDACTHTSMHHCEYCDYWKCRHSDLQEPLLYSTYIQLPTCISFRRVTGKPRRCLFLEEKKGREEARQHRKRVLAEPTKKNYMSKESNINASMTLVS